WDARDWRKSLHCVFEARSRLPRDVTGAMAYNSIMRIAIAIIGIILVAVVGVFIWGIGVNNQLVQSEQGVNETWAQVQNVYQRRADLIPNLVETVKGFAAQERTVLEEVIKARASATQIKVTPELLNDPAALKKFQQAQVELSGALSRLLVT